MSPKKFVEIFPKNGKKNGFGNYSWKESNQQYYGHWKNNAINGYGYVVTNGETTDAGIYTNGKLTKDLSVDYKNKNLSGGNCLGNCTNGYGTIKYNNVGLQANNALASAGMEATGWRADLIRAIGLGFDPTNGVSNFVYGFLFFAPVFLV